MESLLEKNKAIVRRFNQEVIEQCSRESFEELIRDDFINHTAAPGMNGGKDGMWNTFKYLLQTGFPDLKVIIYDQVAEADLVTTRKAIIGIHSGTIMGIPPTGREITIDVMDMIRLRDGKYYEHWGVNTFQLVLSQLSKVE
jgi:predicted ester cyclase